MKDLESSSTKPDIPEDIRTEWQRIVNLMARTAVVPAGRIMRRDPRWIEVFVSSLTEGNPYRKGERADLHTGLYCETVMKEGAPLLVPNALKDPQWNHNPDIKRGMTFYLGYPLNWPDGDIFGTICVLDGKDKSRAPGFPGLIAEFQQMVENDLRLIVERSEHEQTEESLKKALDEIKRLKQRLEAENIYLRKNMEEAAGFTDIVGTSDPIKYVLYRIKQVANARTTVFLTGETGTGKGVFARALHEASSRKGNPFVHVNCAGLPPNLIESELFGREKGAFTGSMARQIGRFELAHGGTIFLDEVAELPLELQAKLLKVIEGGEFERLGSPRPVKVDVRIIASTNRDLEEEIRRERFRRDLFYRLNVFPVTIPPLRQRREDIPLLVKFFSDKFSTAHGKRIEKIPSQTMGALENYAWPGNVRELINVIERAVIVSDGPELQLAEKIDVIACVDPEEAAKVEQRPGTRGLSEVEREHILAALRETGWKIEGDKGAARLLGLKPSTLRARMKKLGIKRPQTR
jgi:formate hydrogenlyase transcriptional activator